MLNMRESLYNLGNDYFQESSAYFITKDEDLPEEAVSKGIKGYSDGLYHYTKKPVYELSGGPDALNKRIFNVPQSAWADPEFAGVSAFTAINAASAVFSDDYATGIVVGDAEPSSEWTKPE